VVATVITSLLLIHLHLVATTEMGPATTEMGPTTTTTITTIIVGQHLVAIIELQQHLMAVVDLMQQSIAIVALLHLQTLFQINN
jgi:hypothetical protein